jgi:uncharacterized protein (TIGR02594 family)
MIDASSEPPWLQLARADLGICETPGPKSNPTIKRYFADAGHPEIEDDSETAWCAAASCSWLRRAGMPVPPRAASLMAMSFESYGVALDAFKPGCICVFYRTARREKDWRRHVAIGVRETRTHIHVIGGNQGNEVSEQRFAKRDLVCMRWPVAATVRELRDAGSTDIASADTLKKVAVAAGGTAITGAAANQATAPPTPAIPDVSLTQATEQLSAIQLFMEGASNVAKLVFAHPWLAAGAIAAVGLYVVARRIERNRVRRAELGHALSLAG